MEEMSKLCFTYSRIMCTKPHSADVERIISANNVLKSVGERWIVVIVLNILQ